MTSLIRALAAAFLLTIPVAAQVFPGPLYPLSWPKAELCTGDGDGRQDLVSTWPAGVPSGVSLWFQVWSTELAGLAASNGVSATTP